MLLDVSNLFFGSLQSFPSPKKHGTGRTRCLLACSCYRDAYAQSSQGYGKTKPTPPRASQKWPYENTKAAGKEFSRSLSLQREDSKKEDPGKLYSICRGFGGRPKAAIPIRRKIGMCLMPIGTEQCIPY